MAFVDENIIDEVIDQLELEEGAYEAAVREMEEAQPVLSAYFWSENFELFTDDERAYLQYLALIIWKAYIKVNGSSAKISEEQISEAEEQNWARLEEVKSPVFRERAGIFFEDYFQEDLLAFAEDALLDDDEDAIVTKEGREPLFVTLKTVIDLMNAGPG